MTIDDLKDAFEKNFNKPCEHIFFCPGRMNLIGEHIDYNGGRVMPCAITMGTTLLVAKNNDHTFKFRSMNFSETVNLPLKNEGYTKSGSEWYHYPVGVIHEFLKSGIELTGCDFLFSGNVPIGSGLSSSASIEVLTAYTLNELFEAGKTKIELALLGKRVENEFMGLNSGIMDQFAVAMGKSAHALLVNCDTLDYEYVPFETEDHILAIINTNKPRKLVESKYNERFNECRTALKRLHKTFNIEHLCEISSEDFMQHRELINDPVIENRVLHVLSENERVKKAAAALASGNIDSFGELMYASHDSLQHLYEVSGKELDTIVDFCKHFDDCIGARMTGAGFGGCAIALVKKDSFDDFGEALTKHYNDSVGYTPGIFSTVIADGVRALV